MNKALNQLLLAKASKNVKRHREANEARRTELMNKYIYGKLGFRPHTPTKEMEMSAFGLGSDGKELYVEFPNDPSEIFHEAGHAIMTPSGKKLNEHQEDINVVHSHEAKKYPRKPMTEQEKNRDEDATFAMESMLARRAGLKPHATWSPSIYRPSDLFNNRRRALTDANKELSAFEEGRKTIDSSGRMIPGTSIHANINARAMSKSELIKASPNVKRNRVSWDIETSDQREERMNRLIFEKLGFRDAGRKLVTKIGQTEDGRGLHWNAGNSIEHEAGHAIMTPTGRKLSEQQKIIDTGDQDYADLDERASTILENMLRRRAGVAPEYSSWMVPEYKEAKKLATNALSAFEEGRKTIDSSGRMVEGTSVNAKINARAMNKSELAKASPNVKRNRQVTESEARKRIKRLLDKHGFRIANDEEGAETRESSAFGLGPDGRALKSWGEEYDHELAHALLTHKGDLLREYQKDIGPQKVGGNLNTLFDEWASEKLQMMLRRRAGLAPQRSQIPDSDSVLDYIDTGIDEEEAREILEAHSRKDYHNLAADVMRDIDDGIRTIDSSGRMVEGTSVNAKINQRAANLNKSHWFGRPILDEKHREELEKEAALNQYLKGMHQQEAEELAHLTYRKKYHAEAAAHHLHGMNVGRAIGGEEGAQISNQHAAQYELHLAALGHEPYGPVPPEVQVHLPVLQAKDAKRFKFKPHGADNFLVTSFEKSEDRKQTTNDQLKKNKPTPRFPNLGLPDDRRETPIVAQNSLSHQNKAKIIASKDDPLDAPAKESMIRAFAEILSPKQMENILANLTSKKKDVEKGAKRIMSTALGAISPSADSNAAFAVTNSAKLHEDTHLMFNRVMKQFGSEQGPSARYAVARHLVESLPDTQKESLTRYYNGLNHLISDVRVPEEAIAHLVSYLNDPEQREFHFKNTLKLDPSDPGARQDDTNLKQAYSHISNEAKKITPDQIPSLIEKYPMLE